MYLGDLYRQNRLNTVLYHSLLSSPLYRMIWLLWLSSRGHCFKKMNSFFQLSVLRMLLKENYEVFLAFMFSVDSLVEM